MFNTLNEDLFVYEGKQNEAANYVDELHIKNARLNAPHQLTPYITYMFGKGGEYGKQNFPLLFNLEGKNRKKAIKSTDLSYTMDVYGKPKYITPIAKNVGQTNAGKNGGLFTLAVKDKLFWKNMIVTTGGTANVVTAQIVNNGINKGKYWEFKARLFGASSSATVPAFALQVGTNWATGVTKVGRADSHGTPQQSAPTPFRLKNQLSVIRHSYTVRGNVQNKKLVIPFKADGKTINFWSDWDYYHNEMIAMVQRNDDLLFSVYNGDQNNIITNTDSDTGEPVPSGAGLWQQITNELTYSFLNKKLIDSFIHDIFYNADPASAAVSGSNGEYVIMGGAGLMMMFDEAIQEDARGFLTPMGDKMIRDGKNGLQYGAYFTEYKHRSGKILKFVHEPAFDIGPRAQAADRHPIYQNMSIMSFSGLALDFSMVESDGNLEDNICLTYEEGREFLEGDLQGLAKLPGGKAMSKYISTDLDRSSTHKMFTQGIHLLKPLTCGKFNCLIS